MSVGEFTKEGLDEGGLDPDLAVVPNGVDLSEFEEVEAEKEEGPTVRTVSRSTDKRRVDFVIRAFERVSGDIPEVRLK